jgi:hypothetical protein
MAFASLPRGFDPSRSAFKGAKLLVDCYYLFIDFLLMFPQMSLLMNFVIFCDNGLYNLLNGLHCAKKHTGRILESRLLFV